jgi:NitT/TauT family transport system substrate-binding protein
MTRRTRRSAIASFASTVATIGIVIPGRAATPVRFLTSWFAEGEHGGYYQAQATGLYAKAGLDVTLLQGSPQTNSPQMLAGGDTELMMGYDMQTLTNVEKGVPILAVAAPFQVDLGCIVAHPSVRSLADLKGHPILISPGSYTSFWPWIAAKYGYSDDQVQPYSYSYQRFIDDPSIAQQGYITYDDYALRRAGIPAKLFGLADAGLPTYGAPIITTRSYLAAHRDVVERFVRASLLGWRDYLRNPAPANALILAANPKMSEAQLMATVTKLREDNVLTRGLAPGQSLGTITDARWQATRDIMVRSNLLSPTTNWHAAYTTAICTTLNVTP